MARHLRIALLVDPLSVLVRGGLHAAELGRELLARGHEVGIFGAPARLLSEGMPLRADSEPRPAGGARVLGFRPDAVLAYDALSPAAWLGSRIARRRRVPLILVEAGAFAGGSWLQRSLWRLGESLWGAYVRRTAGLLVALDPVAREHALREGFSPSRMKTLPQGVDLQRFRPGIASRVLVEHKIRGRILLFTGSLEARAGLELLIAAFARTVGQRGDWSLVLAGDDHAPPRLRACAERLGVGARVHCLNVEEEDLPGLYASSTLVAAPALEDGAGALEIARAMACGRPVLASDLPRLRYLVEPEETGLVAPPGDLAAWVAILQRAASAPEARRRWGERARRAAEERFAWSRVAEAFEEAVARAHSHGAPCADPTGARARARV